MTVAYEGLHNLVPPDLPTTPAPTLFSVFPFKIVIDR